jgi:hypothetical protein
MAGTLPLREGAHRLNAAALIHGELKSEGIVAGRCINIASRPDPAWLNRATCHPIRGRMFVLAFSAS